MMVKTTSPCRGDPGSIPPRGQTILSLIWQKIRFWMRWGWSVMRLCASCCGLVSGLLRLGGEWGWCMYWGLLEIGCVWKGTWVWAPRAETWRPGSLHGSRMGYLPWLISCGLLRLNPGARGEHLTSLFPWVTA